MKRLGLFRHAKSDWDDLALRDFDRGLNERGRRGAALMGRHIREHGVTWDLVLASPAERVRRTLDASGLPFPVRWDEHAYLATSGGLIELLRGTRGDPQSVLLLRVCGRREIGSPEHENELFAAAAEKYPTASFAVLELAIERWSECSPGCGQLVHFVRPRDLDPALGPERADPHTAGLAP